MNKERITKITRLLVFLCGLALLMVLFTPIWRIDLDAPQYPEGLRLLIYSNKIAGDVEIINGLNHYIGMKTLHTEDFIEFKVLPYIIVFFAAGFILVAIAGKKKWIYTAFVVFVLFGIVAMVDLWRWEYNYGHNLDPNAAIIVPGMAYQPPLIGFKQLLNFGAYSIPDTGGWIFIGVGLMLLILVILEWKRSRYQSGLAKPVAALGLMLAPLMFSGCNTRPEPLKPGKDQCYSCKMTIIDERFGAELLTTKSKVFKFDDARCLLQFIKSGTVAPKETKSIYFTNFNAPHQLMQAELSGFLKSEKLQSPMNGNAAAFEDEESLKKAQQLFPGDILSWNELKQ